MFCKINSIEFFANIFFKKIDQVLIILSGKIRFYDDGQSGNLGKSFISRAFAPEY